MRWGIDEVPLLAVTRYALGGEKHRLTVVIALDLLIRRQCNGIAEGHLREDLGTTCQKRTLRMVLYGSRWAMLKEVRMMEDLA